MPQATRISYKTGHHTVPAVKDALDNKVSKARKALNKETTQKIILFATIMALLLLAANLENIL